MRQRTAIRASSEIPTRSWGIRTATFDSERPAFPSPAPARAAHHFAGVATFTKPAVEISRAPQAIVQRQAEDKPESAPEAPAPAAPTPENKPINTAAPEPPQPLGTTTDAIGTTTVKEPPTIIYDEYSGATLTDVAAALPKEAGSATFDIAASTEGEPIAKSTITVTQEVHLPKWKERDTQCAAVQKAWDDFASALKLHEDGHVSLNQSKFANAHRRYKGQPSGDTQKVTDKIKSEAQAANDEYDTKTQHGLLGKPPTIIDLAASCTSAEGDTDQAPKAQAKLDVSQPGDPYELEADRVADQVMRTADPYASGWTGISTGRPALQRKCVECEEEDQKKEEEGRSAEDDEKKKVQRKASGPGIGVPDRAVAVARSGGQPLDEETRAFMEPRFGFDFSSVRVHADSGAADAARTINARAYTVGANIVFDSGRYNPRSGEGRRLLAHELTHVVQQNQRGLQPGPAEATVHTSRRESTSSVLLRQSSGGPAPLKPLPPLGAEELLKFLQSQRGFGTSTPGPPEFDPQGIGRPTGKGYQTYAAIQIIDKEGHQLKVGIGAYVSGGEAHGEAQAIGALRGGIAEGAAKGGKMMVAVEQLPCPGCDSSIRSFAKEIGVTEYSVYVPQRESLRTPGTFVRPKTASTTAFQGGRGPMTPRLVISEKLDAATGALSAEAKAAAREAAASMQTDLKMLRIASFMKTSLAIVKGVFDILTAVEFFSMADSKLNGGAFILNDYSKKSEDIASKAATLQTEYPNTSNTLTNMQPSLFKAMGDVSGLGGLTLGLLDFKIELEQLRSGLDERIKSLSAAVKEADAKEAAAMKILEDPTASGALAMATFGTAELARLFAISQDLQAISGNLSRALNKFQEVRGALDDDITFLQGWYDFFLGSCKGDSSCAEALKSGWYKIIVVNATVPDSLLDTPDCYVRLPKNGLKTSVKDDTTKPVWNEVIGHFRIDRLDEKIQVAVYDEDVLSDDLLASFEASLKPSRPEGETFVLAGAGVSLTIRVERDPQKSAE